MIPRFPDLQRRAAWLASAIAVAGTLALAIATAAHAATPPYPVPVPIERRLDNGLTVAVFRDTRLPLVHVQLAVPAGSATENPGQYGAAHAVSELVGHATTSRDENAMRDDLARAGGTLTTQLGRDVALIGGTFLARGLATALEVTSDAAINAVFTDGDAQQVLRATQLAALHPPDASRQGEDALWTALFGTGGYGHPPIGTSESLAALKLEDLRDFYHAHWTPRGAVLAIAGDVEPEQAFAGAAEWFGRWPARDSMATPPPGTPAGRTARVVDRADSLRCPVFVGVAGPRAGDPDEVPMALAVQLATRDGGLPGLRGSQSALRVGGVVWLAADAAPDSVGAVARALEARLLALRDGPPAASGLAQLARAVTLSFPMRFETLAGLAGQWCANVVLGVGWADLARFPQRVEQATPERIRDAARRWIDRDHIAIVAVGPVGRVDSQVESLAPAAVAVEPGGAMAPRAADLERGRKLIEQAVAAHGGLARLKGLHDSTAEADIDVQVSGKPIDGHLEQVRSDPYRMVLVTQLGSVGARQVLDGARAWTTSLDTVGTSIDADPATVAALRQGFRSDVPHVLLDAAAATRLADRGRDTLDGHPVEKVEAWGPGDVHRTLFLDPATSLLAGFEQQEPGSRPGDAAVTARRVYRDLRSVQGLQIPFAEDRWLGGRKAMELHYTRIAFDTGVPPSLFQRTVAPPALPPTNR